MIHELSTLIVVVAVALVVGAGAAGVLVSVLISTHIRITEMSKRMEDGLGKVELVLGDVGSALQELSVFLSRDLEDEELDKALEDADEEPRSH